MLSLRVTYKNVSTFYNLNKNTYHVAQKKLIRRITFYLLLVHSTTFAFCIVSSVRSGIWFVLTGEKAVKPIKISNLWTANYIHLQAAIKKFFLLESIDTNNFVFLYVQTLNSNLPIQIISYIKFELIKKATGKSRGVFLSISERSHKGNMIHTEPKFIFLCTSYGPNFR